MIWQRRAEIACSLLGARICPFGTTNLFASATGFSDVRSLRRALESFYGVPPSQRKGAATATKHGPDRPILAIGAMFDGTEE